jgi:hypothetical protein
MTQRDIAQQGHDNSALINALCALKATASNPVTWTTARTHAGFSPNDFERSREAFLNARIRYIELLDKGDDASSLIWLTDEGEHLCR